MFKKLTGTLSVYLLTTTMITMFNSAFAAQLVYCPSSIYCPSENLYQCTFNEYTELFRISGARLKKTGGSFALKNAHESNSRYGHSIGCYYTLDNDFIDLTNKDHVVLHPFIDKGAPWEWDANNRKCEANDNPSICPFTQVTN